MKTNEESSKSKGLGLQTSQGRHETGQASDLEELSRVEAFLCHTHVKATKGTVLVGTSNMEVYQDFYVTALKDFKAVPQGHLGTEKGATNRQVP